MSEEEIKKARLDLQALALGMAFNMKGYLEQYILLKHKLDSGLILS